MQFRTVTRARWTSLSSSVVTPRGRCRPSGLGMNTLRTGCARYAPRRRRSERSARLGPPWPLASASSALVRELRRYYSAVRLPAPCIGGLCPWTPHRGPRRHPPWAVCRVSRFSRMMFPRMLGVLTSTAPGPASPRLAGGAGLAFGPGKSLGTWKLNSISRLDTRPACAPVNASGTSSRPCPHDSGSLWVASPSLCDFLLRCIMPVYPGASSRTSSNGTFGHLGPTPRRLQIPRDRADGSPSG